MKNFWIYAKEFKKITAAGDLGVNVSVKRQQIFKPIMIMLTSGAGDDSGGTSATTIEFTSAASGLDYDLLTGKTDQSIFLPNDSYLEIFSKMKLQDVVLSDNDFIAIKRTHKAVNGTLVLEVKGWLSTFEPPTITLLSNCEVKTSYKNKIVGVTL